MQRPARYDDDDNRKVLSPEEIAKITAEIGQWKPQYQDEFAQRLSKAKVYKPFYCNHPRCDGFPHVADIESNEPCTNPYTGGAHPWNPNMKWLCPSCGALGTPVDRGRDKAGTWLHYHARADQRPPRWDDDFLTMFWSSGRGTGKTFGATKLVHQWIKKVPRLTFVGVTGPTMRRDMIEGPSGILATAAPDNVPEWEPSKFELTFPNGGKVYCVSAEEPDRLRGMNSSGIWFDEPAHMRYIEECWEQALLTLRDPGFPTKILCTSTPLPTAWVRKVIADRRTRTVRVPTYRNLHTLSQTFKDQVLDRYEGTRRGRQELLGEVLADIEGALFRIGDLQYPERLTIREIAELAKDSPVVPIPSRADFARVVVGVDPAGTANARSDETGIVVVGRDHHGRYWVLQDATGKYSPSGWANRTRQLVDAWSADAVVAERNYGGDMVKDTLDKAGIFARVITVHSRAGKVLRAEPIAALYEQSKVWHMRGLDDLEKEMTEWVPGVGASPNRVDAVVHGLTEVFKSGRSRGVEIESPTDVQWGDDASTIDQMWGATDSGLIVPQSPQELLLPADVL